MKGKKTKKKGGISNKSRRALKVDFQTGLQNIISSVTEFTDEYWKTEDWRQDEMVSMTNVNFCKLIDNILANLLAMQDIYLFLLNTLVLTFTYMMSDRKPWHFSTLEAAFDVQLDRISYEDAMHDHFERMKTLKLILILLKPKLESAFYNSHEVVEARAALLQCFVQNLISNPAQINIVRNYLTGGKAEKLLLVKLLFNCGATDSLFLTTLAGELGVELTTGFFSSLYDKAVNYMTGREEKQVVQSDAEKERAYIENQLAFWNKRLANIGVKASPRLFQSSEKYDIGLPFY